MSHVTVGMTTESASYGSYSHHPYSQVHTVRHSARQRACIPRLICCPAECCCVSSPTSQPHTTSRVFSIYCTCPVQSTAPCCTASSPALYCCTAFFCTAEMSRYFAAVAPPLPTPSTTFGTPTASATAGTTPTDGSTTTGSTTTGSTTAHTGTTSTLGRIKEALGGLG